VNVCTYIFTDGRTNNTRWAESWSGMLIIRSTYIRLVPSALPYVLAAAAGTTCV
jgi:hypothetical protein